MGPSSGMRMLAFYINRAGKNLPADRLKVLENAKKLIASRNSGGQESGEEGNRQEGRVASSALQGLLCLLIKDVGVEPVWIDRRGPGHLVQLAQLIRSQGQVGGGKIVL